MDCKQCGWEMSQEVEGLYRCPECGGFAINKQFEGDTPEEMAANARAWLLEQGFQITEEHA